MKKIFQNKGFMMVEIVVIISIITVSMLSVMTVAQKSIFVSRQAVHVEEAAFLLEEGAEAIRILRDNTWNNIAGPSPGVNYYPLYSGGTWILSITPNTVGNFTRIVNITNVLRDNITKDISSTGTDDPGTKFITITVSWNEGGINVTKTLSFYIMDIFS